MVASVIRDLLPRRRWFAAVMILVLFAEDQALLSPLLRSVGVAPPSPFPGGVDGFSPRPTTAVVGRQFNRRRQAQQRWDRTIQSGTTSTTTTKTSLGAIEEVLVAAADPVVSLARTVMSGYGASLVEHPLPTKSVTAGVLCGISDVIAQKRGGGDGGDAPPYDLRRTIRFASKGCVGGILWMFWYDWIDGFLAYNAGGSDAVVPDEASSSSAVAVTTTNLSFYVLAGAVLPPEIGASFRSFAGDHTGAVTTGVSMVLEQFLWCPLVYGTFEIPVSTLMNGGRLGSVRGEINSKLNGLLVSNAKVWTLANLVIYNTPLEWRLFLGNCIDILWQSIVSDVSAGCGGGDYDDDDKELCTLEDVERVAATER